MSSKKNRAIHPRIFLHQIAMNFAILLAHCHLFNNVRGSLFCHSYHIKIWNLLIKLSSFHESLQKRYKLELFGLLHDDGDIAHGCRFSFSFAFLWNTAYILFSTPFMKWSVNESKRCHVCQTQPAWKASKSICQGYLLYVISVMVNIFSAIS